MSELILIPYVQINGQWTLTDEMLAFMCGMMVKEGSAKTFFYDGAVLNESNFIRICKAGNVHFMFSDDGQPAAMGMLNNFGANYAHAHWLCFKNIWGKQTDEAISKSLKYWFNFMKDGKPLFDVLLGIYPETNGRIDKFAKESGFTVIGAIPDILYNYWENRKMGAVFSYIERRSVIWDS